MSTETTARLSRAIAEVPRPRIRMVHLGLGAFHRAHQLWYTQHASDGAEWGVAAFSMRSADAADALAPQDGLYTLIERGADGDRFETLWPLVEVGDGSSDAGRGRMVELIASPDTAVVSLTVTEAGYAPGARATTILRAGLEARFAAQAGPIAVVPCDNLSGNGELARQAVLGTRGDADPEAFAAWLAAEVGFVSSSVDRITPRATAAETEEVATACGWLDQAPVVCEPFRSWVLEGAFPAGRPAWESAGARFVEDLEPWERRKLWMLNGSHTLLATAGRLRGHETVAEAIADPVLLASVRDFWAEAARNLPSEVDATAYAEDLLDRFGNGRIAHLLAQIAQDSATKLRVRAVPVWRAERAAGRSGAAALAVIEGWVDAVVAGVRSRDAEDTAIDAALAEHEPRQALLRLIDPDLTTDMSHS